MCICVGGLTSSFYVCNIPENQLSQAAISIDKEYREKLQNLGVSRTSTVLPRARINLTDRIEYIEGLQARNTETK